MSLPRFVVGIEGKDFRVIDANNLMLRYLGLVAENVVGHKLSDFLDAEKFQHFNQSFEVCVSKKKSVTVQALPDVPNPVRIYGFYISPILDDAGNILYLDIIGQLDVADQSILQRERDDAILLMSWNMACNVC